MKDAMLVAVRESCGTYVARCNGFRASATSSKEIAAERAAIKAHGPILGLIPITNGGLGEVSTFKVSGFTPPLFPDGKEAE
jgi:hypothetical protein